MYSRYAASGDAYIPARGHEPPRHAPERHEPEHQPPKHGGGLLGGLFSGGGLFDGFGRMFKGLKRRDGRDLDMGDIILLLILLLLFMEDGESDWMILIAAILILGL